MSSSWRARFGIVGVSETFRVGATNGLKLLLNPVDSFLISAGTLTSVAELGQAFNYRFVAFQIETGHELFDSNVVLCLEHHGIS